MRFQIALPENVNFTQYGVSAVSPDGRKIAFAAYGYDGAPRVWIRSLDSPTATPLTDARINQQPVALLLVARQHVRRLRRLEARSRRSTSTADHRRRSPTSLPVLGGTWSPDGTILIGTTGGIMKMPAAAAP